MKNNKKALLLSSITALSILCGCGTSEVKTLKIDGETYIQSGNEYVKYDTTKVFEPGTHIIYYVYLSSNCNLLEGGYGNSDIELPVVPEGYKVLAISDCQSEDHDHTSGIIYYFVNEKTVEAKATYNEKSNRMEFSTPGTIIEESKLTLGG